MNLEWALDDEFGFAARYTRWWKMATLALGGMTIYRRPVAFVRELCAASSVQKTSRCLLHCWL